ncbi:MAG: hypothetical protein FJZ05_01750 [Candidatus Nealsonbacteria bacterium]|nr:hypothetical protein [Candidatus Nealsonbacteria bacterium]
MNVGSSSASGVNEAVLSTSIIFLSLLFSAISVRVKHIVCGFSPELRAVILTLFFIFRPPDFYLFDTNTDSGVDKQGQPKHAEDKLEGVS